jgi:hypothetical protein
MVLTFTGLSKVGTQMALTVLGQVGICLVVSGVNIPALQEFGLVASLSIVMDFFMQITFFTTVLSIDIRRLEVL